MSAIHLAQLSLTRIMVAQRPEKINAAERVVMLKDGRAIEVRSALNLDSATGCSELVA